MANETMTVAGRPVETDETARLISSEKVSGTNVYNRAGDSLGDRLIAALRAGLAAGGEVSPVRSAGLVIAEAVPWPVTDLRVDWHDDPVGQLAGLWPLWQPQAAAYVDRALQPDRSS